MTDTAAIRENWRERTHRRLTDSSDTTWRGAWSTIAALCDALDAERATVERTREVLRGLEWKGRERVIDTVIEHRPGGTWRTDILARTCVICGGTEPTHAAGCGLKAALEGESDAHGRAVMPMEIEK